MDRNSAGLRVDAPFRKYKEEGIVMAKERNSQEEMGNAHK